LQEAKEALSGDKFRLKDLQRLLRTRQQRMVSQVAGLYPVRVFHDLPRHAENPCADTNGENPLLPCLFRNNGLWICMILVRMLLRERENIVAK
jgi:hypothetical protein